MDRHYFDWAAAAVADYGSPEYQSFGGGFLYGNPSSPHLEGQLAREGLESARRRCAAVLGVPPETLYFSSGGTESNGLVILSQALRRQRAQYLYSQVEHPSVRENCLTLARMGKETGVVGVEQDGRISAETLRRALEKYPHTRFAALMAVNNETGALNAMEELSALLRSREGAPIHFHSDLVQAIGKVPVNLREWDLDSASFSAHKLGGPRGIGLLYLKKPLDPLFTGGDQEQGIRPGTENTPGALAMADCLERHAAVERLEEEMAGARRRWKRLIGALKGIRRCALIPGDREAEDRRFSPWILQARFRDVPGEVMVRALDDAGFAVSTGSACSSKSPERPVLAAMGLSESAQLEGIRISQGWSTSMEDIEALIKGIEGVLTFL
jgi:cysteine desulfurase